MEAKALLFFAQGHVLVLDTDIQKFRDHMRETFGVIGFDETINEHGIVHVKRWEQ